MAAKTRSFSIEIDENYCKGCSLCIQFCPAKVFAPSEKLTKRGYFVPAVANPQNCTGCLFCEHLCPDIAIQIVRNTPKTRGKKLSQQKQ
ncbi:MAG: ferredoxin family protein [Planctomycetota bacterium]|nr:ferredoxin family protein [Planctomycetota bacterium]